jgi:hypothetical protein
MTLTKKQIKAIQKAEKLIIEAQSLFNEAGLGKDWCPIFGQTEGAINRASDLIKSYSDYKLNN